TLERHHQHLGGYFAEQGLDAPVIDISQIIEDEHQVFDLCRQVFVDITNGIHQLAFNRAVEEVHDVGGALHATQSRATGVGVAGELLLENLVELFQGRRLHGIERRQDRKSTRLNSSHVK